MNRMKLDGHLSLSTKPRQFLGFTITMLAALSCAGAEEPSPSSSGAPSVAGTFALSGTSSIQGGAGMGSGGTAPSAGAPSAGSSDGGTRAGSGGNATEAGAPNTSGGGQVTVGGSTSSGGSAGSSGASAQAGARQAGTANANTALPWLHVEGNKIKNEAGATVILRGVALMDLGATDEWYGGAKAMVDRLTNENDTQGSSPGWYPRVLRFAVYPADGEVESPLTYRKGSDEFYEDLLRPIVDYCKSKGLYAIIDWHYIDDTSAHVESTRDFWAYIAPKFASDSNVIFELYNEPIDDGNWSVVRANMQTWYDTVRESAPKNLVLVGTPNWSSNIGPSATNPVEGKDIAYVAHMYPYHYGVSALRNELTSAAAAHPVFVTEWGFDADIQSDILVGTISSYGNPFKQFLEQNGASWTAWVASYDWTPRMFANDRFELRVGEGAMGGFVKDWLYERREADQP